jgi:hypothetical protein
MSALSLGFLSSSPPPPKVALLPDGLFFVRAVEMPAGVAPAEVGEQVELALETLAPFPLAQLYYGYFWVPGSARALVFAAYRRRFTAEQVSAWDGVELVLPAFAALLGGPVAPATTVLLAAAEGLTALHWDSGPVPAQVLFSPLLPEATGEERVRARDELLRRLPSREILDLVAPPVAESSSSDRELVFRCGEFVSRLPREAASALDLRDKEELVLLRRGRARALWLWRALLGCFIAAGAMALGEVLLLAGGLWQTTRLAQLHAQAPGVDQIITAQSLGNRINELSTKRLLPLEMLTTIVGSHNEIKPPSVVLTRMYTNGELGLTIEAQTSNPGDINVYQNALAALPALGSVVVKNPRQQNNVTSFILIVTFKPGVLQPMPAPTAS